LNKSLLRKSAVILLYLLSTSIVLFIFIVHPGIDGYYRAMFPDMVYGKAYKPFVYRTLFPSTIRAVAELTPESIKETISSAIERRWKRNLDRLEWDTDYTYEYLVALALMFFCFFGFAFALRHLTKLFYDFPPFVADLAPVGGLLALPLFFRYYSYIYDPGTLLLFSLAIGLIATRRHLAFYLIFILATLNKETAILLTVLFFLKESKSMARSRLMGHGLLQFSLWIVIRAALVFVFRNNEGSLFDFHLVRNLGLIFSPLDIIYFVGVSMVFFVLVRYEWKRKPAFVREGLLVTLIPMIILALIFGYVDELRDYYEAFPFLFLLSLPTMIDVFEISSQSGSDKIRLHRETERDQAKENRTLGRQTLVGVYNRR
jgi:hypothetical protein